MKSNIKIFLLCILGVTVILSPSISRADITGSIWESLPTRAAQ